MGGLHRGKIECFFSALNRQDEAQGFFKNLYDYFTSHPNYTLIALQYGSSANLPNATKSGLGTGYWDDTTGSFGYNAFFVVRANATAIRPYDVYHLIQWSGSNNQVGTANEFGQPPGSPGLVNNTQATVNAAIVGHQAAIGIGGTGGSALSPNNGNPWRGGMNALTGTMGIDQKAQSGPIWSAPSGGGTGVIIFPRSNDGIGSHRSLTQNCGVMFNIQVDTQAVRMNIVGDDDSFILFYDQGDAGSYIASFSGLYTPRPNIPSSFFPYPYAVIDTNGQAVPWSATNGTIWGDQAGSSSNQGGIVAPVTASTLQLQLDFYNGYTGDANFHPNHELPGTTFDEIPIPCGVYETTPTNYTGFLGYLDQNIVRYAWNLGTNTVKTDFSRIFIGTTTVATYKYSVPWDSATQTVPRSGNTRGGVTFVAGQ